MATEAQQLDRPEQKLGAGENLADAEPDNRKASTTDKPISPAVIFWDELANCHLKNSGV